MKATIFFNSEDVKNMLMERWAPRSDAYLRAGPEAGRQVRIKDMHLSAYGLEGQGYVKFTDEPEEKPPEVAAAPSELNSVESEPLKAEDDNLPF